MNLLKGRVEEYIVIEYYGDELVDIVQKHLKSTTGIDIPVTLVFDDYHENDGYYIMIDEYGLEEEKLEILIDSGYGDFASSELTSQIFYEIFGNGVMDYPRLNTKPASDNFKFVKFPVEITLDGYERLKKEQSFLECNCGGKLQLVEEVSGSFVYQLGKQGIFDWGDKEFYGDTSTFVECTVCEETYNFNFIFDDKTGLERITIIK